MTTRTSASSTSARSEGVVLGSGSAAESVFLHAIFAAGLRAVREHAEQASYAADAAAYESEDAERRAVARRRRPEWADED
jgi:hypothetical protein